MKKFFSVTLALVLVAGLLPIVGTPSAVAAADVGGDKLRDWYYADPVSGVSLTGQAAFDMLSGMTDLMIAEESGEDTDLSVVPFTTTASLDYSVYDVLNFRDRGSRYKILHGQYAVVSSGYEAVEYFMYRIMSGTGRRPQDGTFGSVYVAHFMPDVNNLSQDRFYEIFSEMTWFIRTYFLHAAAAIGSGTVIDNAGNIEEFSLIIGISNDRILWEDEYSETERLMTADVSGILDGQRGVTSGTTINSGTDAEKMRKAHDYIAATVVYDSLVPWRGQPAYSALVEGRGLCYAYAQAYSMLCLRMGLNVPTIVGEVDGEAHAWNLNLTSYPDNILLTDPTWNRMQSPSDANGGSYTFVRIRTTHYDQPLDNYRAGSNMRTWSPYVESYIHFVNDWNSPNRNRHKLPKMIFDINTPIPGDAVIVPSTTSDNSEINLTTERISLPTGFTVAAFSTDGGTKWKRGALPDVTKFPRLLNKGLTLHVTNNWNQSAKKPADGAQTIEFPAIGARPKRNAEKLKPFYGDSHWLLTKKGSTAAVFAGLEYSPSSNGKTPNSGLWFPMPEDGIPIASGSTRQTYLVRAAPNGSPTAASTHWRVRPVNFGKVPAYSIRQVKVSGSSDKVAAIAFRRGDQYTVGYGVFMPALTAKTTIPVSELTAQGTVLRVRKAATGKRPPSEVQTITLPAPA
jgi:hypothetical protein